MKNRGMKTIPWRTKSILEHLKQTGKRHNLDPRFYLGNTISDFSLASKAALQLSFKKAEDEGGRMHTILDEKMARSAREFHKCVVEMYKCDPKKMNFYNENYDIDLSRSSTMYHSEKQFTIS